jgi:hypothetical protein
LVRHGETCEQPTTVVATPIDTSSNTDSICYQRTTCGGCLERSECGVCTFLNGDTSCRAGELTRNGETGPDFCTREKGTWSDSQDICTAAATVGAVNNGEVNHETVNQDLANDASSTPGYIVVVLVITQAEPREDGSARFQVFIDVSGSTRPLPADEERFCTAVRSSLAKHLGVDVNDIICDIFDAPTKKRATYSYIADMTVGGPTTNIQGNSGSLAVPMIVLAAVSPILSIF